MTGAGPDADALVASLLARTDLPAYRDRRYRWPGGRVPLAVSGGADSLTLLVLAAAAGLDPVAIHVDHGIRAGSADEARVVAAAAARFGAGFEARRVSVGPGPDLEARARRARYDALPAGVLTGHTMDDQAETVLLNVLRGAALDGLAGMRPGAPDAWSAEGGRSPAADRMGRPARPGRPLLRLRRSDTAGLCDRLGLRPVHDPSNEDRRFRRNRVRTEVIPLLCDVAQRDVVPILARQADLVTADVDLLEELARAIDPTDTRALRAAPLPLARRALRRWLRRPESHPDVEAHPPSAAELARVLAVVSGSVEACELSGGRRVERRGGRLGVVGR